MVNIHSPVQRLFGFSAFLLSYITFLQILKLMEDYGKLKFEKGSLCHIMCSSEQFHEHGMAWRYLRYTYS